MSKGKKYVRRVILIVLLICTAFLIYSIIKDPLGANDIMLAVAVTVGFIALEYDRGKKT